MGIIKNQLFIVRRKMARVDSDGESDAMDEVLLETLET